MLHITEGLLKIVTEILQVKAFWMAQANVQVFIRNFLICHDF